MRPIDADALMERLEEIGKEPDYQHEGENWCVGVIIAQTEVDSMPTLDYKDLVPQGEWIERIEPLSWCEDDVDVFWDCSVCETPNFAPSPFCPNCGARMKGGE